MKLLKQQGIGLCLVIGMMLTGNPTLFARFSKNGSQSFGYKSITKDFPKPITARFKESQKDV